MDLKAQELTPVGGRYTVGEYYYRGFCLNKIKLGVFVVKVYVLSNISQIHLIQIIHKLRITSAPCIRTLSRCIISNICCVSGRVSFSVFRSHKFAKYNRFLITLKEVHSQPCSIALGILANRSYAQLQSSRHKNKIYSLYFGSLVS